MPHDDVIAYVRQLGDETIVVALNAGAIARAGSTSPSAGLLPDGAILEQAWSHRTVRGGAGDAPRPRAGAAVGRGAGDAGPAAVMSAVPRAAGLAAAGRGQRPALAIRPHARGWRPRKTRTSRITRSSASTPECSTSGSPRRAGWWTSAAARAGTRIRFAARGFTVAAVDLSRSMLEIVGQKACAAGVDLLRVEANLCRLGCFPDATFDYALSMFSTLGMIRGRDARRRALAEVVPRSSARAAGWRCTRITSGSTSATARAGPGCSSTPCRSVFRRDELGERRMTYRGIPGMRVHLYRWGELNRSLRSAGFRIDEVLPLDEVSAEPIRWPRMAHNLRAGGWIVFASRL